MEYSALGDAINVAARMEQAAAPGTVLVANDTYKLVRNLFEFEALGAIEVKGKLEPIPAYRVIGRTAEVSHVRGIEGLHAALVGRAAEMQAMHGLMSDLRQGVGRIVFVLGEAGVGKTRLLTESHAHLQAEAAAAVRWIEIPSLSYEANQAYGLFQRLIRRVAGIQYNDPAEKVRAALEVLVGTLPEERRSRALQIFQALFNLERANSDAQMDGETFRREICEAMELWWRQLFASQPAVLVFDDMHWCDAASVDLLRRLLPLCAEMPLVLLCAMRGERAAPAWQIKTSADEEHGHRYLELTLRPLSEAESNELVDRLLGRPDLPPSLRANMLDKSGGNPFFIEEVVRALIDSGALVSEEDEAGVRVWRATTEAADFSIPDNLQSLLAARLDRLEEATRGTLQIASVIGRSFHHRVLEAVDEGGSELDRHLGTLMRMDLIRESARLPEIEYAFRNPLTQEAVYKTILLRRRRAFHQRVADAMESIYVNRLESLFGMLAHHFALAGEVEKAIEYLRKSATQAFGLFAYEEAIQNLRGALGLIAPEALPETRVRLLEELGDAFRMLRDIPQSMDMYHQSLGLRKALTGPDPLEAVRLRRKIVQLASDAKWSIDLASYGQVKQTAAESLRALEDELPGLQARPDTEIVRALATLSFEAWRSRTPPDWERAERYAKAAVEMAERLDEPTVLARALGALANVLDGRSQLRGHLQVAERRLEVSRDARVADPIEKIEALSNAGMALLYVGQYDQALPLLHEAEAAAEKAHSVGQQVVALGLQAQCAFRLDQWGEVLQLEERWRQLERKYPRQRVGPTCFYVALGASVRALRGEVEPARVDANESVEYMVSISGPTEDWARNQVF
jgi:tetratricopeptide (TPR) repeat protein